MVMFIAAAAWLLAGSILGLIASIKFHAPAFLADAAWLTYGRVKPAAANCMLYGFAVQAGLGVALWLLARLGRTQLAGPGFATFGAVCWNGGVLAGVVAILSGGSAGYEGLEIPRAAQHLLLLSYLIVAVPAALTFHRRVERSTYVSQWFLFAALFWFPWIQSTAALLLSDLGARGMAQAVMAWWYAQNLQVVWLALVGVAALFYFVPKLTGRDLHSRHLALLAFWTLILFGSWGGIPATAPVPAWMPVFSAVATVMSIATFLAVAVNAHRTLDGRCSLLLTQPGLRFICFVLGAFVLTGFVRAVAALPGVAHVTQLTWLTTAISSLNLYAFFAMVMFGAAYYIAPRLTGMEIPYPRLVSAHFWVAAAGVLLLVLPLAVGGVVQGLKLQHADIPFADITKATLHFLRVSTMGELLLVLGHLMLLLNLIALAAQFLCPRAKAAWEEATAEAIPAEVAR